MSSTLQRYVQKSRLRINLWLLAGLLCAANVGGCTQMAALGLPPLSQPNSIEASPPRINGAIQDNAPRPAEFATLGNGPRPAVAPGPPPGRTRPGDVTLNFVDTDIREVARTILGTMLKARYTIDPAVHGTATFETGTPVATADLVPTLEMLLNQNGATIIQRDGIYRVTPIGPNGAPRAITGAGAPGAGVQVVALRYASAKDLAKVLEPYVTEGGKISADPGRNALLVSGDASVRNTLISLIRAFDIDMLAGQSFALFPAGDNGSAEKMAGELEKVFRTDADGPLANVVRIVPLPRVNAVLVASSQPRYIDEARRVLGLERRAQEASSRTWHVYYVQNGQSSDLENLLQRAFTPGRVTSSGAAPGSTAPGADQVRMASASATGSTASGSTGLQSPLSQNGGSSGSRGGMTTAETASGSAPASRDSATAAAEPLSTGGGGREGENENRMRIIANRRNNALLIYATPSEYSVVEGMLRKIDIVPLQVLIEATIAEVTLNDALNYGTQFYLGHTVAGVLSAAPAGSTVNQIATIAGNPAGFAGNTAPGFVVANGVREVLNALSAVTQVKVLSAPQVMVLDNEPARLQVGSLVPVLTQSQQSTLTSSAPIVNSIDYRDTGVIMVVTPQVNSGGLVSLTVSQEVSDVADLTTGNINSPTFNQRLIRTHVAVQDGQTLGLAGLIRDSDSESNSGIPVLKDIPLLGSLVSSQSNSRQRTELLVLITPHVVRDQRDARSLTDDLRNQLINAGLVPQDLQNRRPSGAANPNGF